MGHPLATDVALTQGSVILRSQGQLFVRLLGGEGDGGAPIVDSNGRVVAMLQDGYGGRDIIGQRTSGLVSGYDFSSRWAAWRATLCKDFPSADVPHCP